MFRTSTNPKTAGGMDRGFFSVSDVTALSQEVKDNVP